MNAGRKHKVFFKVRRLAEIERDVMGLLYPEQVKRPQTRGECTPCPICQAYKDGLPLPSGSPNRSHRSALLEVDCDSPGRRLSLPIWKDDHPRTDTTKTDRLPCGHGKSEAINRCRPCGFCGCRHNLFLEAMSNGSLKANGREPWDIDPARSCTLDRCDDRKTLAEVGDILGLTRERTRQIETQALLKLARRLLKDPDYK